MPTNVQYTGDLNPGLGWKPKGALAGMLYRKDRQRYDDVSSLQDYMTGLAAQESTAKLQDYFADAPVRSAERLSKIAEADANAATIGGIKLNELNKGTLQNQFDAQANPLRVEGLRSDNEIKGQDLKTKQLEYVQSQLTAGLNIVSLMATAMDNGGPLGVEMARQTLEESGLGKFSAFHKLLDGNPQQVRENLATLQKAKEAISMELAKQRLHNEGTAEVARISARGRVPGEKEFKTLIDVYEAEIRRRNPDMPLAQVKALAAEKYQQNRRFGSDPQAAATAKATGESVPQTRLMYMIQKAKNPNSKLTRMLEQQLRDAGEDPNKVGTNEAPIPLE